MSKQPRFKVGAVRVSKLADGSGPASAPTTTASRPARGVDVLPTMHLPTYLMLLEKAEATLADGYRIVAEA